jgi:hypothetical protein
MKSRNHLFQILIIFSFLVKISEAGCLNPSKCITTFPNSFVNLSQLCNDGQGYKFTNTTTGQVYSYEICGSIDPIVPSTPSCGGPNTTYPCTIAGAQTNTYCNAEYNSYPFEGSLMVFFDPSPYQSCVRGGCPNTGFFSPVLKTLGQNYCCTGQCEIIDIAAPINVEYLAGPLTGIQWSSSLPPNNGDEYQCPIDPLTGNPSSRSVTYIMYCNANGSINDPIQTLAAYNNGHSINDPGVCRYTLVMSHFVACGTLFPSPSPSTSPTSSPSTSPSMSPSSSITPLPTPSNSPSPSAPSTANNLNSFATSIPLITSMSLASFFGSIVFAGIAIYCCNRLRTYGDDDAQNEPLLPDGVAKPSRLNKSVPKLNQVQAAARLNPAAGIGSGGGGELSGSYQDGGLTDEQIYIRRLPKKFKEYLEKQGAVDPNTGSVRKQIQIKEDQLMKFRALGVSNVILTELESTYKVISFSEA